MFGFDLVHLLALQSRTITALAQNGHCLYGTKAGFAKIMNTVWFCRADPDTSQVEIWGLLLVQSSSSGLFCSSLSWLLGLSLSKLCPGVPQQKLAAPGQELLSEYFKVGQAGSCFVRFISKDFQCLQWEAIFVLSRGYLLL